MLIVSLKTLIHIEIFFAICDAKLNYRAARWLQPAWQHAAQIPQPRDAQARAGRPIALAV